MPKSSLKINLFLHVTLLLFTVNLSGCLSHAQTTILLKKSTEQTPSWVQNPPQQGDQILAQSQRQPLRLTFQKTDIYNLPLGIKQAQKAASEEILRLTKIAMRRLFQQKISIKKQGLSQHTLNRMLSNIDRMITSEIEHIRLTGLLAEDVYWEQLTQDQGSGPQNFYVVWVLIQVPKAVYDRSVLAIAHDLGDRKDLPMTIFTDDILQELQ